jgi:hypothetical protein
MVYHPKILLNKEITLYQMIIDVLLIRMIWGNTIFFNFSIIVEPD